VTVDALNCQRAIAQQIVDQAAITPSRSRQSSTLHTDVAVFLDDPLTKPRRTYDGRRRSCRIETRGISFDRHRLAARTASMPAWKRSEKLRAHADRRQISTEQPIIYSARRSRPNARRSRAQHWRREPFALAPRRDHERNAARNRMDNGAQSAVLRTWRSTSWQGGK